MIKINKHTNKLKTNSNSHYKNKVYKKDEELINEIISVVSLNSGPVVWG